MQRLNGTNFGGEAGGLTGRRQSYDLGGSPLSGNTRVGYNPNRHSAYMGAQDTSHGDSQSHTPSPTKDRQAFARSREPFGFAGVRQANLGGQGPADTTYTSATRFNSEGSGISKANSHGRSQSNGTQQQLQSHLYPQSHSQPQSHVHFVGSQYDNGPSARVARAGVGANSRSMGAGHNRSFDTTRLNTQPGSMQFEDAGRSTQGDQMDDDEFEPMTSSAAQTNSAKGPFSMGSNGAPTSLGPGIFNRNGNFNGQFTANSVFGSSTNSSRGIGNRRIFSGSSNSGQYTNINNSYAQLQKQQQRSDYDVMMSMNKRRRMTSAAQGNTISELFNTIDELQHVIKRLKDDYDDRLNDLQQKQADQNIRLERQQRALEKQQKIIDQLLQQ